jgi:hypothetical protein
MLLGPIAHDLDRNGIIIRCQHSTTEKYVSRAMETREQSHQQSQSFSLGSSYTGRASWDIDAEIDVTMVPVIHGR